MVFLGLLLLSCTFFQNRSIITIQEREREREVEKKKSWWLDLRKFAKSASKKTTECEGNSAVTYYYSK
jgi:hypothetical protein